MNAAVAVVVFLPLVVVWCLALYDVVTRRDVTHRRRLMLAVVLIVFVPVTILYLLARPPSSVRRGPEDAGDARAAVLDQLEAQDTEVDRARARELAGHVRLALSSADGTVD